jgi:hypothetical protein
MVKLQHNTAHKPICFGLGAKQFSLLTGKWRLDTAAFLLKKTGNVKVFSVWIVACLLLAACHKPVPNGIETVAALRNLQDLATVEYTVTKVVKANDNIDWYKPGERKILITCQASVKAGIDLSKLQKDDINISGKSITITLPAPKILTVNMPPENIKVAYSEVGFFRSDFTNAERDALMAQAEKQIWNAGEALGILQQAKLNTETFMNNFLLQLGFEKVLLTYDATPANNNLNSKKE